jgi:hypothetical protein
LTLGVRARAVAAGVAATLVALVAAPSVALACSICRCGDPTFNALGKEGFAGRGFRVALDWERFDKTEGDPAGESESQVENRTTAFASYGFGERLTLFARVPWSVRDLTATAPGQEAEDTHTSGLSDPEIYGQMRIWASPLRGAVGRRASLSLVAGVKMPWGENDVGRDGERVDEHAQPGTGSTDFSGGLAFLYLVDPKSAVFASSSYRHTGTNDFAYRYGSTLLATVAYEHKLPGRLDAVVGLDFRHAQEDRIDAAGTLDPDTGGSLLYVTPRLLVGLGRGLVLRAGAQIPVWHDLDGFQKERTVVNVGLAYLFSR